MFHLVKVSADNKVSIINCESRDIPLSILQDAVKGSIEIVHVFRHPDLAMVVNDNGHYLGFGYNHMGLPTNIFGSGLYANLNCAIKGDVVFCTFYNPDPAAEPDVYAFDSINALKVKSFMEDLIEEYRKAGFIS